MTESCWRADRRGTVGRLVRGGEHGTPLAFSSNDGPACWTEGRTGSPSTGPWAHGSAWLGPDARDSKPWSGAVESRAMAGPSGGRLHAQPRAAPAQQFDADQQ